MLVLLPTHVQNMVWPFVFQNVWNKNHGWNFSLRMAHQLLELLKPWQLHRLRGMQFDKRGTQTKSYAREANVYIYIYYLKNQMSIEGKRVSQNPAPTKAASMGCGAALAIQPVPCFSLENSVIKCVEDPTHPQSTITQARGPSTSEGIFAITSWQGLDFDFVNTRDLHLCYPNRFKPFGIQVGIVEMEEDGTGCAVVQLMPQNPKLCPLASRNLCALWYF